MPSFSSRCNNCQSAVTTCDQRYVTAFTLGQSQNQICLYTNNLAFQLFLNYLIYLFAYFSIQLNSEIKTINISYESPLDPQTCGGQTLRWPSLPTSRDSCSHMIFSSQGRSDLAKLIACPFNAKVSQGTDVTLSDSSLLTLMKQEATSWRGPCNQKWSRAPSQQRAESCSRPSNNSRDL